MRLAEWDSIVASLWSEDLLVPTSGDKDDGNETIPADGVDGSPSLLASNFRRA